MLKLRYLIPAAAAGLSAAALAAQVPAVGQLRCEYRDEPRGIDTAKPRLSWVLREGRQTAYQVVVDGVWDSGRVESDQSLNVPYGGPPLASSQRVTWRVRTWPGGEWSPTGSWTMGVLSAADWKAEWIGAIDAAPPARAARGYHAAEATSADEEKWVQVDLGQPRPFSAIRLCPMRHADRDGFGFPVRFRVEAADEPDFRAPRLIADHTAADYPSPGLRCVAFDAPGATARYVRVTATRLGKFTAMYCFALSQLEVVADGRNVAKGAKVSGKDSVEAWGWGRAALTDGRAAEDAAPRKAYPSVMLRRVFGVRPGLQRAVVHVCGLGAYEMSLNGARVGADLFPPGWSKYDKTCLYDTHEIAPLLREGANEVALLLGNGMYNVPGGRYAKFTGSFGPPKAIAQIRLEYRDGTSETVGTDARWQVSPGPIAFSCVYGGEDFDARWSPDWEPARVVPGPGGALKGLSGAAPPVRSFDLLRPAQLPGGVYDLGQNASVMPRLAVRGPAGATVKITPSELIAPSGGLDDTMCGGRSYWTYTLAGTGEETWFPKFFYRGARYLGVECGGGAEVKSIEGVVVHSSAAPVGEFACSNELFNRIRALVRWAQRSNLMSVITDCPHREKLGWLEQYHLNGPSLRYEFDLATLFAKGMNDMADSQLGNGLVPDIAPEYVTFSGGFRDSPEWGSAVVLVPWQQYQFCGDDGLLRRHYEAMRRYVAYLGGTAKDHLVDHGLGDWYDIGPRPPGASQLTPRALTATAIYYEDVVTMANVARLLGKTDDARGYDELAGSIRSSFHARFPDLPSSQTGLAMPLVVGLVEPGQRRAVLDALVADVRTKGLTAGDVGYRYLLRALADGDRSDVVYALNNQSEKPGYGYQLRRGATSLTEAWDAGRGSSQNHFMLGQIVEWLYHDLAGIQPAAPGFKQIVIKPAVVGDLTWVRARHDSPYGRIESRWMREGDRLTMEVVIPANTTARVHVPGEGGGVRDAGPGSHRFVSRLGARAEHAP